MTEMQLYLPKLENIVNPTINPKLASLVKSSLDTPRICLRTVIQRELTMWVWDPLFVDWDERFRRFSVIATWDYEACVNHNIIPQILLLALEPENNIVGQDNNIVGQESPYDKLVEYFKRPEVAKIDLILLSRKILTYYPKLIETLKLQNIIFIEDVPEIYEYIPANASDDLTDHTVQAAIAGILMHIPRLIMATPRAGINILPFPQLQFYYDNVSTIEPTTLLSNVKASVLLPDIVLIQQYFKHPNIFRQNEYDECLEHNLACPYIDRIVMLTETPEMENALELQHPKIYAHCIGKRLTFSDAMIWAAKNLPDSTHIIIANLDIYFDDTLKELYNINMRDTCLALLRHDVGKTGPFCWPNTNKPRQDSQDAWMFQLPFPEKALENVSGLDIQLGQRGCDNAIAYEFVQRRFRVANPGLSIRALHLHNVQERNYGLNGLIVRPKYILVQPFELRDKTLKSLFVNKLDSSVVENFELVGLRLDNNGNVQNVNSINFTPPANASTVYKINNAFASPNGNIFDFRSVYDYDENNRCVRAVVANKVAAVPIPNNGMLDPYKFLTDVLPRILRILDTEPTAECRIPDSPQLFSTLLSQLRWPTARLGIIPYHERLHVWASEVLTVTPLVLPIREDLIRLRSALSDIFTTIDSRTTVMQHRSRHVVCDEGIVCGVEIHDIIKKIGTNIAWSGIQILHEAKPLLDHLRAVRMADIIVITDDSRVTGAILFARENTKIIEVANEPSTALHYAAALKLPYYLVDPERVEHDLMWALNHD